MTNQTNWKLIQEYVTGNISPEGLRELEEWASEHPDNQKLLDGVVRIWELSPREDFGVDVHDMWENFYQKEIEKKGPDLKGGHTLWHQNGNGRMRNLLRVAAVALVSIFASYFTYSQIATERYDESEQLSDFYLMQEMVTGNQEKASIIFSDGTEVILNASSSLRFPKKFNESVREIYLDGEAYFNVSRNPDRPFIVRTEDAMVKVLGTKFNVQAWSEDVRSDIVVREGKVSVSSSASELSADAGVILSAGEFTKVKKGLAPIQPQHVDAENYLLWTEGGLHFEQTPLQDVIRNIERRFQVEIVVHDEELLMIPFTSTFHRAELDEILTVIAASVNLEYLRDGNTIEFRLTHI